jgi:ubiquinone biosynthesis protein UbiJ
MASHHTFQCQQTLLEAQDKATEEWAKLLCYGLARLTTTTIQELDAMSKEFERLQHKLDRIEKKIGSTL